MPKDEPAPIPIDAKLLDPGLDIDCDVQRRILEFELSLARLAVVGLNAVVYLNRYDDGDDLHRRNRAWLADRDGLSVLTSISALVEWTLGRAPLHCGYCGKPVTECDSSCTRPLDLDRFCVRCGRRVVVSLSPVRHSASCKLHGTHCA